MAKDVLAIVAILVGGVWTYYLFVRKRLLSPRLKIEITPTGGGGGGRLVLIRCLVSNPSSVRITPTAIVANVYHGYLRDGRLTEKHVKQRNLLDKHRPGARAAFLEPGSDAYVDLPVLLPLAASVGADDRVFVLVRIGVIVMDDRFNVYRQDARFAVDSIVAHRR